MTLPLLQLDGGPYDQGRRHGEALQGPIAHNLAVYFWRFAEEAGLPRGEVLTRAVRYARAIEAGNPAYFAGMRGIAEGGGFDLGEIVALNVRYEILYYQFGVLATGGVDGCTAFAVLPAASANGHLLLGENWDWIPDVRGAVVRTAQPDGLPTLSSTEAGLFGAKIGLNPARPGPAINGLAPTADDRSQRGTAFHVGC